MWKRTVLIGAGAVVALVVSMGCSNSSDSGTDSPPGDTTSAGATAAATTTAPVGEAHNDADVTFAQNMIPHHEQAIEMGDIVLAKQGIDPRIIEYATQINAAQGPEIQQMQGWLNQWGAPPTSTMPSGDMNMPGHGDMPGMSGGHGMMSEQDMAALQNAQGTEANRLYLTQMIEHHEGAITMARTEIDEGQYPPAVELARSIVASQQQEIDSMKGVLASQ